MKEENPNYLHSQLITYIGNKRSLLPFIEEGVNIVKSELKKDNEEFIRNINPKKYINKDK